MLLWSFGNYVGTLNAARGYDSLIINNFHEEQNRILALLWSLKLPLKIICFTWLLVKDKILTWDHLQSRGFYGPSRCFFCEKDIESCDHMFLLCPFIAKIFTHLSSCLSFTFSPHSSVRSFLSHWFNSFAISESFLYTPVAVFWYLWLFRNNCIFENNKPYASLLISKIESFLALYPVPQFTKKSRQIGPKPIHSFPVGYFDGAAQLHLGGAGFVIYISETHYFSFFCGLWYEHQHTR